MRKVVVAEWILSLIVSREAAASIVGDLVEDEAARGGTWFWSSVAGTLTRQTVQHIIRLPGAMLVAAGVSWGFYVGVGLAFAIASLVVARTAAFTINLLADHTGVGLFVTHVNAGDARVLLEMLSLWVITPAIVGAFWARRVRGFEIPTALVMSATWPLAAMIMPFVGHDVRASDGMLLIIPCLIAGAIRQRRTAQTA